MRNGKTRSLIITHRSEQGRDTRSFRMLPEDATGEHRLSFLPGQVAVLQAGDGQSAYFAFASAPEDEELEFLIKRTGGDAAQAIFSMQPGQALVMTEVVGRGFALDAHRGKDLVFIAMGTGIAPLRSALRHALGRTRDFGSIVVLYGARTPRDFCYLDETESWEAAGVELRQVVSRPDGHDWSGPTGYVQSLLDHILPDLSAPVALVCGSREMIEQTQNRLRVMGFAPEGILTNY